MESTRAGEVICLVVDDEPAIRAYLIAVLERGGIQCLEAGDAVTALRILHKLSGQIDLLITDIRMPGDIDGVDLALSARSTFPDLPVILVSGFGEQAPAGFPFVQKPFLPDKILEIVGVLKIEPRAPGKAPDASPIQEGCAG